MEYYFVFVFIVLIGVGGYHICHKMKNYKCRHVYYHKARIKAEDNLEVTYYYVCAKCGKTVEIDL